MTQKNGFEALKEKIKNKDATVAVIGQGYVGLPLAMELIDAGFRCIGIDVDTKRVEGLNRGESYIFDISSEELKAAIATGRYSATTDYNVIEDVDIVSICVPTPLRKTRDPDISYIQASAESMAPKLKGPVLIILESTTYPGTTEEVLVPLLENETCKLDEGLFVAFSPERVDPGNKKYTIENTPKIVGGVTPKCTEIATLFYSQFVKKVFPVSSISS